MVCLLHGSVVLCFLTDKGAHGEMSTRIPDYINSIETLAMRLKDEMQQRNAET